MFKTEKNVKENLREAEYSRCWMVWRVERTDSPNSDVSELEQQEGVHLLPAIEEVMPINIETNVIFQIYSLHLSFCPK